MVDRSCGSRSSLRPKFPSMRGVPATAAALASYRELAPHYDVACVRIAAVREYTLGILDARSGETIVDVACGSGAMLPALAARVGSRGRVIGIEQSPEMLALARSRFAYGRLPANVELVAGPAEMARLSPGVAAFVCSYAHDVLQSPADWATCWPPGNPAPALSRAECVCCRGGTPRRRTSGASGARGTICPPFTGCAGRGRHCASTVRISHSCAPFMQASVSWPSDTSAVGPSESGR